MILCSDTTHYLPTSTVFARAPPLALLLPLEEEDPSESLEELLILSLSCPLPHDVVAHPPRSGRRLSVGELSEVVSGALLSMLAMPTTPEQTQYSQQVNFYPHHLQSQLRSVMSVSI